MQLNKHCHVTLCIEGGGGGLEYLQVLVIFEVGGSPRVTDCYKGVGVLF